MAIREALSLPGVARRPSLAALAYLREAIRPDTGLFLVANLYLLVGMLVALLPALLAKPLFDLGLLKADVRLVAVIMGLQLLFHVLSLGVSKLTEQCFITIGTRARLRMAGGLYANVHGHALDFFINTTPSEISQRLTSDTAAFESVYKIIAHGVFAVFKLILVVAIMLSVNAKLAVISFLVYPGIMFLAYLAAKKGRELTSAQVSASISLGNHVFQTLNISGYLLLTASEAWKKAATQFEGLLGKVSAISVERQRYSLNTALASNGLSYVGLMLVYVYGVTLIANGQFSLGSLMTFIMLVGYMREPVAQLAEFSLALVEAYTHIGAVRDFSAKTPKIKRNPNGRKLQALDRTIELSDVSFGYSPGNLAAKNISFNLAPGEITALIGPNGAGKTTLAYLLMRFFDPDTGRILVDGHDLKSYAYPDFREIFYYVPQDSLLYNKSVRENLLASSPSAGATAMQEACGKAGILDRIVSLPMGFDTVIGEAGYSFSGGERQKLNLARIFLRKPKVLILDEPTAAMDPISEGFLMASLRELCASGVLGLMITHRMRLAMAADRILVLNEGKLVQQGTHDELSGHEGLYRTMLSAQTANLS